MTREQVTRYATARHTLGFNAVECTVELFLTDAGRLLRRETPVGGEQGSWRRLRSKGADDAAFDRLRDRDEMTEHESFAQPRYLPRRSS